MLLLLPGALGSVMLLEVSLGVFELGVSLGVSPRALSRVKLLGLKVLLRVKPWTLSAKMSKRLSGVREL